MIRRATLTCVLLLCSCVSDDKKQAPTGAASTGIPRVSGQPPPSAVPTGPARTDGREIDAGKSLHATASQGCPDRKCLGDKCGKLCVQFMAETYKESDFRSVKHKNDVYFNCLGACLGGPE